MHQGLDLGVEQHLAVAELDLLNVIGTARVPALQNGRVAGAYDVDLQVVAGFAKPQLTGADVAQKLQHVGVAGRDVFFLHGIGAIAPPHKEYVVAFSADQGVGAPHAVQHVVARVAGQDVVQGITPSMEGRAAAQRKVLDIGREDIVHGAGDCIHAFIGVLHHHIARVIDRVAVVTRQAFEPVRPKRSGQPVRAKRAGHAVDRAGRRAGHTFRDPPAVDVADGDTHALTGQAGREGQGGSRRTRDGIPACAVCRALPFIAQASQAVRIHKRDHCGQDLALLDGGGGGQCRATAPQADHTRWRVVDVGHRRRGRAGHTLHLAKAVDVNGFHADGLTHLGLAQGERGAGSPRNRRAIGQPLVAYRTQAVQVGQCVGRGQDLILRGVAADGHCPGGRVIDVDHRRSGHTCHAFGRAKAIRVAGFDADLLANLGLA